MQCLQGAKVKHFDFSNVIYHKFSHGAISYTLNGENVNVMLELTITHFPEPYICSCIDENSEIIFFTSVKCFA